MINLAVAKLNLQTAGQILYHTELNRKQLLALKASFPPLTSAQVSLKRPMIAEYNTIQYYAPILTRDQNIGVLPGYRPLRYAFKAASGILYKKNRTLKMNQELYEPLLAALNSETNPLPAAQALQQRHRNLLTSRRERGGNPGGIWLLSIGVPSFQRAFEHSLNARIRSDLLAMEIDQRLGEASILKDPYCDQPYTFDHERRRFFSAGPDGKNGTPDDIYLDKG